MKLLFLGVLPLFVFWFVEEKFGAFWGIVAAIVWALGECAVEKFTTNKVNRFTIGSTALVVVMGGIGILLDQSAWFKFQPVVLEVIMVGLMVWESRKPEPLLLQWSMEMHPNRFSTDPQIRGAQVAYFKRMSLGMSAALVVHSIIIGYYALYGSTEQWLFWKTGGLFFIMLLWFALEMIWLRIKMRRP